MIQGIFIADGPSDLPLARHLERICSELGAAVSLTPIDPRRIAVPDRTVGGRLRYLVEQRIPIDILFVHRDAEAQDPELRRREITAGALASGISCPVVPVVPVRMTEAWLLLDEAAVRYVAARPNGRVVLELPSQAEVERLADPKAKLADVLLLASETSGRPRRDFTRAFGRHRQLLLERLDISGPVASLPAWQRLRDDIEAALARIEPSAGPS